MYDNVKYLYNLDYVDKDNIRISEHSTGKYNTAYTLYLDNEDVLISSLTINRATTLAYGLGLMKS